MTGFSRFCDKVIVWSFYSIFVLVPLIFAANTSELFEFNKMWVAFAFTILIGGAWFSKMIVERRIYVQRTVFDIPILLFLCSQLLSTIFSIDPHISWWGYYSRFNGGFLSLFSYVLLYYAFVSNISIWQTFRMITVSLVTGLIVALWGLPSHFGYDPTCFVFRGSFDTACWTDAFKPTIRAFSTLGQPAWFAAYLAFLLPVAFAYTMKASSEQEYEKHPSNKIIWNWKFITLLAISMLFYMNLIFADTRAGTIAFFVVEIIFWVLLFIKKIFTRQLLLKYVVIFHLLMLVSSFLFGMPMHQLDKFTLGNLMKHASAPPSPVSTPTTTTTADTAPAPATIGGGITDSGVIRLFVWKGAIDAWKDNPIFGTGAETFAFAYYKYRPVGHNMTSEWDYLYNKAHNEYLNYLTTTGIFGLGTYLAVIAFFIYYFLKMFFGKKHHSAEPEQDHNKHKHHKYASVVLTDWQKDLISIALFSGWLSILITNFFGFSVVIMNLFLFLTPAFYLVLNGLLHEDKLWEKNFGAEQSVSPYQWTLVSIVSIVSCFMLFGLVNYWTADVAYALGTNLDHVGSYQQAYDLLSQASKQVPDEPVYKDELAINMAVLTTALASQKESASQQQAQQAASTAIGLNDEITTNHPANVVFLKNRVRILYTLAQVDQSHNQQYMQQALQAITKANQLAPTDAKISYNLGLVYGQLGQMDKAIETLNKTIQMKPDYKDAYAALGLFYHQISVNDKNKVTNPEMHQKAIDAYNFILQKISPGDKTTETTLKTWESEK
jgi:putative inorganic carbon (HCO3(-)) transporter